MLQLPEDLLPEVIGNTGWIYQIITIFLDNAIAYGCEKDAEDGKNLLTMKVDQEKENVRVSVIDHGKGIPDDTKSAIFDRFYREDKSRNKKEHFGLGLSIALMLSRQLHAKLQVKDTPGGGAAFSLSIPTAKK
jgi:signal transduction histidine kinase